MFERMLRPLLRRPPARLSHQTLRLFASETTSSSQPTITPTSPAQSIQTTSTSQTPPPPPPPKKKRRPFRALLFTTFGLIFAFYGGGTYYSLVNDNFHDFFTEYIPFAEDAVLFFEEREFRRRFGENNSTLHQRRLYPQTSGEGKVTVSSQSGVKAREAGKQPDAKRETDLSDGKGRHISATEDKLGDTDRAIGAPSGSVKSPVGGRPQPKTEGAKSEGKDAATAKKADEKPPAEKKESPATQKSADRQQPQQSQPAKLEPLDPLNIPNSTDPIVQSMSTILNNVITVLNATDKPSTFSSTIAQAKDSFNSLAAEITTHRASASREAEAKLVEQEREFDSKAKLLIERAQREWAAHELAWREEYESEREKLAKSFADKLKAETAAAERVADQKRKNELLQQEVRLNEAFAASVRDRVEEERQHRLAKLGALETEVKQLSDLASKWGEVLDRNLATQHLVVAVEAVRAAISQHEDNNPTTATSSPQLNGDASPTTIPFVHELSALKEVADSNAVVNSAIASLNPSSYMRGIPSNAQLIDRFRRVAHEVRKAALLPEDAGVSSHVANLFVSKFMFHMNGATNGNGNGTGSASGNPGQGDGGDVENILARTEALLEEGNLDAAAREVNGLTGWAKVLSRDWLGEVRRVLEVRQAMDVSFSSLLTFFSPPCFMQDVQMHRVPMLTSLFSSGHLRRSETAKLDDPVKTIHQIYPTSRPFTASNRPKNPRDEKRVEIFSDVCIHRRFFRTSKSTRYNLTA